MDIAGSFLVILYVLTYMYVEYTHMAPVTVLVKDPCLTVAHWGQPAHDLLTTSRVPAGSALEAGSGTPRSAKMMGTLGSLHKE